MNDTESLERFREGLKISADRARQLSRAEPARYTMWQNIANTIDEMRQNGEILANARSLGKRNMEEVLKAYEKKLVNNRNG